LIEAAAALGLATLRAGSRLETDSGLSEAVDRDVSHGAAVDATRRQDVR
jgi:hypothetical protein